MTKSLVVRAAVAILVGLGWPSVDLAWKCRRGFESTEACVWGHAYLPLTRGLGMLLVAPVVFVALTLARRLWSARRGRRS